MRNYQLTRYVLRRNLGAAVLGMAVSTLNTVIDAFLMGNLLGPEALSAINLSMPLNYALVTVQCILASGASLRMSKRLGERRNRQADEIFTVSLASIFAAGLILMLLANRITGPVVRLLCTQPSLMADCLEYSRVEILCSAPIMFQIALSSFAQRAGNPKIVVKANIASLVANISMDVIYVKVLGLGIGGAALATGTGALAACGVMLVYFVKEKPLHLRLPGVEGLKILAANISTGAAGALQAVATSVLTFVLNFFIQRTEGADGVFVLSVGMNFLTFALFFAMGVTNVYTSMGSMMHGQGDDTGLRMLFRSCIRVALPITCALVAIQLLFPQFLAGLFGARTESQLEIAGYGLRILSLYSVPLALLLILISNYQVLGRFALATGVMAGMLGLLPLCLWLVEATLPARCIWYAIPLSAVIILLVTVAVSEICRRGKKDRLQFVSLLPTDTEEKQVFEGTVELRQGDRESFRTFTDQTIPFFEALRIDRRMSFRIRLCTEEMLDFIISQSQQKHDVADVRIVATANEVSVLIRDNLPPYDPLTGEDHATNRKIIHAFCPKTDYRNTFLQNVTILDWMIQE